MVRFLPPRHSGPNNFRARPQDSINHAGEDPRLAFRGQYEHNLDSKDRLTVPARFRAGSCRWSGSLGRASTPASSVYPTSDFARFEQGVLAELNPLSRHGRMMKRRFHGRSHDETLDSAGRVRIPRHLIEHAELAEGPCVVIGVADHLEIWNTKPLGRRTTPRSTRPAAEIAEELAKVGRGRREAPAEVRSADLRMATLTLHVAPSTSQSWPLS